MKAITCFIESLAGGGAEHQMLILCKLLYDGGYDVTLVTYADVADHYSCPEGVMRVKICVGGKAFRKAIGIFLYFLRVKTDCIISYRVAGNFRALLPLLLRPRKKIIVGERNLTLGASSILGKINRNFLYYRANYIVPNSFSQERYLLSLGKRWGNKVRTIINYTDIEQYAPTGEPNTDDTIQVGVFARFSPQKNPRGLADAMAKIKEESTGRIVVHWYGQRYGKNGELCYDYMQLANRIEELRIGDVFFIHDAVPYPQRIMHKFHALCLPSIFEGFSNSIAEGICCGKPMLVSDVSDNSSMVKDGINGFLFRPEDSASIVEAFMKFYRTNREKRIEMSKNSRSIAEALFNSKIFISKYISLIEK